MKKIIKNYWPVIVLSLLCLLIISVWFKDQKFLATGEEGLILTNPQRAIELYKYSWNELGPGYAYPGLNTTVPFLTFESWLFKMGTPVWLFQASIFYVLMFLGAVSIFALTGLLFREIIHKSVINRVGFIAAIFYILNPISLLGVWFRFALSFEFFYALVPLFFYLYIYGIRNKKHIFIVVVPVVSLLFSFVYSAPALTALIWLLPFMYSLILYFTDNHDIKLKWRLYPLFYFVVMFSFWVLINLWWILPYVELSKIAFASETSPVHAIGTLKANSLDFGVLNVVRLIHGGFLYRGQAFGSIYKTSPFILISWFVPLFAIYGLYKLKPGSIKIFFIVSFAALLFLVKGISPPLGGVFLWLFKHIIFMQVYRNPLEKIGMLLPTIYAPLIAFGILSFSTQISKTLIKKIFFVAIISSMAINIWPFFTGAIVRFDKRDIRVEVPDSFNKANRALSGKDHIIFSLPAMGGASGRYQWKSGYAGVESSEYLFNYPVIVKFYDAQTFFAQMLISLSQGKMDSNLISLAQLFSADTIAFRKDTDVAAFGEHLDGLEISEKMINNSQLTRIYDSEEVSLWSISKDKVVPVIYLPKSIKIGGSPQDLAAMIEGNKFNGKEEAYLCTDPEKCSPNIPSLDLKNIEIKSIPKTVTFQKISPSQYNIAIFDSTDKFLLVFNNSYHPGWKLLINGQLVDEDKHIVANGYANGFIIDKIGDYTATLQFQPQKTLAESVKISQYFIFSGLLVLLGATIYQGYRLIQRHK